MIAMDKEALPKRITRDNVSALAGEHAHWFCPVCRKWRMSPITAEGIACPVCSGGPDWERRPPTLAYKSRFRRVQELCAEGSDWRNSYDEAERNYADYIDDAYAGYLPRSARESGWRHFQSVWREANKLADYLLTAPDAPVMDVPHAYSESGLQRRYYDGRREHNTVSLSDLKLQPQYDDDGAQYTDQEVAELISLRASHMSERPRKGVSVERYDQLCDRYFQHEFLGCIADPLERNIAEDLSMGASKRDVERKYRLSEQQVRTIVKHIGKSIKNYMNIL